MDRKAFSDLHCVRKDIRLAVEAAKMVDANMVIGLTVLSRYEDACQNSEYNYVTIMSKWLGGVKRWD